MDRRKFIRTGFALAATAALRPARAASRGRSVIVVGAGMAGLSAARTLHDAGFDVEIIEARTRLGGRIDTRRDFGCTVDLGAEWIHGITDNPLTPLAELYGSTLQFSNFNLVRGFFEDGTPVPQLRLMRVYGAVLGAMGEELESGVSIEAHLREKVTPTLELPEDEYLFHAILGSMMLPAVGELGGIDLKEFNATEEFEGGDWRFVNGYDSIVYGLARGLSIRTGVHVDRIVTSSTGAEVHAGNESWAADYAVVTLPLSVLQSGAVTFEPTLPESIGESIRRLRMGRAEKIALRFPEAFWPAETTLVVRATDELSEFPIFFNNHLPFTGDPILTTWVVGDRLSAFNQLSDGDSAAQVMDALRKTFGSSIPDATGVLRSRWCDDPLSLGVYSTFELGVPSRELRRRFESSVQKRLHFAGEHTHPDRCSTVHGAYLSGQRAAEQIAAHAA